MERSRSFAARLLAAARASPWASLVARAALVGCALLLLAWVGSTAASPGSPGPALAGEAGAEPAAFVAPDADAPTVAAPEADAGPGAAPRAGVHARASPDDPVYLNRATVDDLRRLPGCGEKRAEAILTLRKRLGRFSRVEELLRVKGVGRTTLKKWRPLVRVDVPEGGA